MGSSDKRRFRRGATNKSFGYEAVHCEGEKGKESKVFHRGLGTSANFGFLMVDRVLESRTRWSLITPRKRKEDRVVVVPGKYLSESDWRSEIRGVVSRVCSKVDVRRDMLTC